MSQPDGTVLVLVHVAYARDHVEQRGYEAWFEPLWEMRWNEARARPLPGGRGRQRRRAHRARLRFGDALDGSTVPDSVVDCARASLPTGWFEAERDGWPAGAPIASYDFEMTLGGGVTTAP
jgi:hypothetical protein